jgi:hypothetical protein
MMRAVIVYDRKQEVRLNGMAPADETYDGARHRFVS